MSGIRCIDKLSTTAYHNSIRLTVLCGRVFERPGCEINLDAPLDGFVLNRFELVEEGLDLVFKTGTGGNGEETDQPVGLRADLILVIFYARDVLFGKAQFLAELLAGEANVFAKEANLAASQLRWFVHEGRGEDLHEVINLGKNRRRVSARVTLEQFNPAQGHIVKATFEKEVVSTNDFGLLPTSAAHDAPAFQ
jgi:hypothetical protein